jgi:hypothetical protein
MHDSRDSPVIHYVVSAPCHMHMHHVLHLRSLRKAMHTAADGECITHLLP